MRKGSKHSPESIEKNRLKHQNKKDSAETIEKKRISHLAEKNGFYGKHHSEKTLSILKQPKSEIAKVHMSESKKGIIPKNIDVLIVSRIDAINSEYQKQRAREYNTGLIRSYETKQKISENRMGLCRGQDNPSWKGGITPLRHLIRESPQYYKWRDAVYARDGYKDVTTGESGSNNILNAHHIVSFADIIARNNITTFDRALMCEELWDVSNGITLTERNHHMYHSKTGLPE